MGLWSKRRELQNIEAIEDVIYTSKMTKDLSDDEMAECSHLFSTSYGKYSQYSPVRPGEQIKMSSKYYVQNYRGENFYVAMARHKERLVAHAFYIRKKCKEGMVTWVLQLVVDKEYRKKGIASTLLRSIWGFSDDFAWGLASANPCTVKTLESATFRKCRPAVIQKNLSTIKEIGKDISFVRNEAFEVTGMSSQIDTEFYIDNSEFIRDYSCEKILGKLKPGREWLAFTFRKQAIDLEKYHKNFPQMVSFSEKILREAYNRMDMKRHSWTKGTVNEVGFIEQYFHGATALDLGCGMGRHALALAKKGYNVTGVDFSETHLEEADRALDIELQEDESMGSCGFVCGDARIYRDDIQYDNVIILYDVIGSFPKQEDNMRIIQNAWENLVEGGTLAVSVMNMELTDRLVNQKRRGRINNNPDILLKLKPGRVMQSSGNIFKSEYLAIDTDTGLVYRKEQFGDDNNLSAEYIIRDKRYYMNEIAEMVEECGFDIIEKRYVRAGHFDEALDALDTHAKEILIIAAKGKRNTNEL